MVEKYLALVFFVISMVEGYTAIRNNDEKAFITYIYSASILMFLLVGISIKP